MLSRHPKYRTGPYFLHPLNNNRPTVYSWWSESINLDNMVILLAYFLPTTQLTDQTPSGYHLTNTDIEQPFSTIGNVHFLTYQALHVSNWIMSWLNPSDQEGNWGQNLSMGYMLICIGKPVHHQGRITRPKEWGSNFFSLEGSQELGDSQLNVQLIQMSPPHVSRSSPFLARGVALA